MSESGQSADNDHAPSTPQLCMDIVQDYAKELFSKVVAVKAILAAFDESGAYKDVEQDRIDTAIGTYIAMLDQHDDIQRLAAIRGERSGANYEQPEDERAQALSSTSKRHHSESPSTRTSTKRRSPDETLFAWLVNDEADTMVLTASQELTRKLVQNHVLDLKVSKRMVLALKRVPEFPDPEWNNILAGKVVNLDAVFSRLFSTLADDKISTSIGDFDLCQRQQTCQNHPIPW